MNTKPGFNTLDHYLLQASHPSAAIEHSSNRSIVQPLQQLSSKSLTIPYQSNETTASSSATTFHPLKRVSSDANSATAATRQKLQPVSLSNTNTSLLSGPQTIRILTCPISKVIRLHKCFPQLPVLFEVFATVIILRLGRYATERVVILRNDGGPVLQGLYYEIDFQLADNVQAGSFVRCVGKFTAPARFQLLKITNVQRSECGELILRLETLTNFVLHNFMDKQIAV